MTMIKWLGTTSVLLALGTAVAVAQAPQGPAQKRDEIPRVQAPPSKDAERPATGDKGASERSQDRAQQPESKAGAKDERRQAEEPTSRDSKQPTQQSQDQKGRDGKQPADQKQQSQDQRDRAPSGTTNSSQQSKDGKQPAEQKQQQTRDGQQKQDNRTGQTGQPAESKQPAQAQPAQTQPAQPAQARPAQQQPSTGQASDQTQRRESTSVSANINDDQRTRIIDRMQRERTEAQTNVNIQVNIGARLPSDVRGRPLPPDIVQLVPQYRGYEFMVVRDEIVIIEPGRREIVDVISRSRSGSMASARVGSNQVVISSEQRETLKRAATRTTGSTQSSGALDANCLQLQAIPQELARDNPQLSSYRMLMIGDQIVLVDPEQRKVVEVVE